MGPIEAFAPRGCHPLIAWNSNMKIAILVVLGLAAAVAAVFAIGALLPVAHTARREARVAADPERVWAVITDFAAAPTWRDDVETVESVAPSPRSGANAPAWKEIDRHGQAIVYENVEAVPARRLVRRIASELPFGGRWTIELVPDGAGTIVRVTEDGEVYAPLYRFVSRFVLGHTATIERYLAALTRKLTA
jgi:uncharacterized protein YndB with AHSA1/START domain